MTSLPIADYAMLGDCHSAALVSRDGSVDWWCPERFDSRAVFSRILDRDAGHFSIRPADDFEVERRYVEDTMVLETTFKTASGSVRVTDALALAEGDTAHEVGLRSPHILVRDVVGIGGEVEMRLEFCPRPEYGLVVPELQAGTKGVRTAGGADTFLLASNPELRLDANGSGTFTLSENERAGFALHHSAGLLPAEFEPTEPGVAIEVTIEGWRSWTGEHQRYEGAYAEVVNRSALVLQSLTYQPSGALVAAPTTSLPEIVGGEANWDYRYSWLRDASLTLRALWVAACPDEATRYFEWMARAVGRQADRHVQIMFGVEGERDLTERELDHLAGYRDSKPVRVGNEAWRQRQSDVMGEILEAAWVMRERLEFDPDLSAFLCDLAERAAMEWDEPDAGIWEGREGERHYTSSKVMCWVALDRAVKLAPELGEDARVEAWSTVRDEIRDAILECAWNDEIQAYAGAFESDRLDASVLLMPIFGLVDGGDERMVSTLEAIERDLGSDGLIKRWTGASDDEGAFVICSFWLANCWARAGNLKRAREVFERVLAHANDVGLLAEEIDVRDGSLVGNFPQAFSHVGMIMAAWAIDDAERQATAEGNS